MADNKEALRALKIKTGVMTRVKKELAMYQKEVTSEGAKLQAMHDAGRDSHDIKQQVGFAWCEGFRVYGLKYRVQYIGYGVQGLELCT
jgi:hypothetical protein